MIRSTLATLTKQTIGRVRRRTPTKTLSITLVVRNCRHCRLGKLKLSRSGKSRASRRTTLGVVRPPALLKPMKGIPGSGAIRRQIDDPGIAHHPIVMPLPQLLQNVPHLLHPAILM
jgi:hypothetical protein